MRSALADERCDDITLGLDRFHRSGDLRLAEEVLHVASLRVERDGHDDALGARSRRAAGAVQVRLVLHRRVDVHDQLDVVDVHTARGDVGRNQYADAIGIGVRTERRQVAVASVLRQVPVQVDGGDAGGGQLLRELLGLVLRAREQDAAATT